MSDPAPAVYVVLGLPGSGRREAVADLIEGGLAADDAVAVLVSGAEAASPADDRLRGRAEWTWDGQAIGAVLPPEATVAFFVTDGRASLADQMEALKPWLAAQGAELVRVITVMHCGLTAEHAALLTWHDACIHFSDVLLLNRRDGVPNKWVSDFRTRLQKQYLPVLVEVVKKGRVANPALILDSQVRRLTHWFDEEDPWLAKIDADTEIVIEDEAGQTTPVQSIDELEAADPYLARRTSGRRLKELPDVNDYVPA